MMRFTENSKRAGDEPGNLRARALLPYALIGIALLGYVVIAVGL